VLSPTTEEYDRGEKFERYKSVPSLDYYLLVSQTQPFIEVFVRADGWARTTAGPGDRVTLASLGVTVDVDEMYANPLRTT
jgi:Uma2 family endonuclease